MPEQESPALDTEWYVWFPPTRRFFGSLWYHLLASAIYLGVVLFPLQQYLANAFKMPKWLEAHPMWLLWWGLFACVSHPVWVWLEHRSFEKWCKHKPAEEQQELRTLFETNVRLAESFWKSLITVYAAATVFGLTKPKESSTEAGNTSPPPPANTAEPSTTPTSGPPKR
jgi:hypothetical protein